MLFSPLSIIETWNCYSRQLEGKAKLHYIGKAGHVVQTERPCAYNGHLKKFLPPCMKIGNKSVSIYSFSGYCTLFMLDGLQYHESEEIVFKQVLSVTLCVYDRRLLLLLRNYNWLC